MGEESWLLIGAISIGRYRIAHWLYLSSGEIVVQICGCDPDDPPPAANQNTPLRDAA
jgi:hypothetical protein